MKNLLLIALILLASCATRQKVANSRLTQLQAEMGQLIGSSEDGIISKLGVPDSITEAGSFKIYRYKKVFGTQGGYQQSRNLFTGEAMGGGRMSQWDSYDQYDIYFKGGTMQDAKIYVQR